MVKITFKNVGQGDSIILEWDFEKKQKIAIIDCNLYEETNPVLDYIRSSGIEEIDFMILSHPHLDHFSGFVELIEYCVDNNIVVNRFLHTAENTLEYLKTASRSIEGQTKLRKLFVLLKRVRDLGKINVYAINDNPDLQIPLGDEFFMEVLAPSAIEKEKFIYGVKYPFDEEESTGNPNANWLATVLKIYNEEVSVLLTSDVESSVLSRIGKKNVGRIYSDKILLGQIPHHGSKGNLNKLFWQRRKRHTMTPLVISVGENTYNHPSNEVVDFFDGITTYKVLRTDDKSPQQGASKKASKSSAVLDVFSNKRNKSGVVRNQGDKTFIITGSELRML